MQLAQAVDKFLGVRLYTPWVPSDRKNGIGETVKVALPRGHQAILGFWISSGFVSFDKPQLFSDNSRPKTIEISAPGFEQVLKLELSDTPDLQYIRFETPDSQFEIKILNAYPGAKYRLSERTYIGVLRVNLLVPGVAMLLTLMIDKDVIEKAKEYAQGRNNSVSSIVEEYLMFRNKTCISYPLGNLNLLSPINWSACSRTAARTTRPCSIKRELSVCDD